ncbi:MAG: DUF3365 domain-containing protein [Bacteroidales bacterium]|nr:DUF3365 domain-containing protein [Bacteroidales bacterium]
MKLYLTLGLLVGALLFSSCSNQEKKQGQRTDEVVMLSPFILTDSLRNALILQGNKVVNQAQVSLQRALKKAIKSGGMEHAIQFCNSRAIVLTDSVSNAQKVQVRRLAKKYRNPLNETDSAESKIFKDYILAWLKGKTLAPKIIPNEKGQPVYYKPIGIQPICLNCHGKPGKDIPGGVADVIAGLYPEDKAVDFKKYELRGMWAVTFPDYVLADTE